MSNPFIMTMATGMTTTTQRDSEPATHRPIGLVKARTRQALGVLNVHRVVVGLACVESQRGINLSLTRRSQVLGSARRAFQRKVRPIAPAGCLVESWHSGRATNVSRLLDGCEVEVLQESPAKRAGVLRQKCEDTVGPIDAMVG
jgi:hypothetical protein